MYAFLRTNQLNLMLILCGACGILAFLLFVTRFLTKRRKYILILMELVALFLLWFDRLAYIYSGNVTSKGSVMVRLSNFMVFFLTPAVVLCFNLFIRDYMKNEGKITKIPRRIGLAGGLAAIAMVLAMVAAVTGLYYSFDENNIYHY